MLCVVCAELIISVISVIIINVAMVMMIVLYYASGRATVKIN